MRWVIRARIGIVAGVSALALTASSNSQAQTGASTVNANSGTPSAAQTKADRKAARKQARTKRNAELKKLEDAGYNPSAKDDANYPQDLQNAEKKAGLGAQPSK